MAEPSNNETSAPPIDAGGASSALLGLDPTQEKDRALMRRQMTRNPTRFTAITEAKRTKMVELLDKAAGIAERRMESPVEAIQDEGAALANSVVKTFAIMDGLKQKDEHAEKGIGDGGPPTIIVQVVNQVQQGKQ